MISLQEMAAKLKTNVLCDFPDDYVITNEINNGFSDADIREGVKIFSSVLLNVFDIIIANADDATPPGEAAVNSRGHTNIYAGIRNPLLMLYCIGLYGTFGDVNSLLVDGAEINKAYRKMRGDKPVEYLRLLQASGLSLSADITAKSFNLLKSGVIEARYPADKKALIGLKLMAEAVSRAGNDIMYVFARCDYRVLSLPKNFGFDIREVTNFLPENDKNYFIILHDFLISNKCKCESKNVMNEYIFSYISKQKKAKVFSICVSMDESNVKLNSKLISEKPDLLANAPESIKNAVKNGYTCAKKNDPNACNPKCAGKTLNFNLDGVEYLKCWILNFNLPVNETAEREYILEWLKKELA